MLNKKRGQITVFIIIGLLIIFTFFVLSYYKKESIEDTAIINPELVPVQDFVKTCTKTIAREAIEIIGVNGGYIDFPLWVRSNPNSYLQLSPIPELKNPYWWFDGRDAIPPLDYIVKQIEDYTQERIGDCLDNFSAFKNEYEIEKLGDFDVIAEIGEQDVTVKTIYPIEVKDKFNKTLAKLQNFPVTIPVRLKQVYDLANTIMERENKDFFIEKKAIDLISVDDDTPTTGLEIQCGKKQWLLTDVENKIKELLQTNLPFIRIKGTNFDEGDRITPFQLQDINPFSDSNTYNDSYYYYHYIWDVSDKDYKNMGVSFNYDERWPINLNVRPASGKILSSNPQRAGSILSMFCLHIWHFTYDIIFPVKVTVVDEETDRNERYSFTFAFKAQVNHNMPDRTNFAFESFDTRNTYQEEEFCSDVTNTVTVFAQDKVTQNDLSGVNLTFTCGRFICNMGLTETDWEKDPSGIPRLQKKFPYCANGILRGEKPGYEDGEMFIQTGRRLGTNPDDQIGEAFNLILRPVREFNFTVVKHELLGQGIGGEKPLGDDEQALITVKNTDENFETFATYPLETPQPLKLLDKDQFTYDLEIYTVNNETLTGGYKSDWTVTRVDLNLGRNITFHTVQKDFKDDNEMYDFFAKLEENSKIIQRPQIK
jgi:hypothetical protein